MNRRSRVGRFTLSERMVGSAPFVVRNLPMPDPHNMNVLIRVNLSHSPILGTGFVPHFFIEVRREDDVIRMVTLNVLGFPGL